MKKVANKIAVVILVMLTLAFGAFSFISYKESESSMMSIQRDFKVVSSYSIKLFVENYFTPNIKTVAAFSQVIQKDPSLINDLDRLNEELTKISTSPASNGIYIIRADNGDLIGVDNFGDGKLEPVHYSVAKDNYDGREKAYYKLAVANGKMSFITPYVDETTKRVVISIANPIYVNGKLLCVVVTDVFLNELEKIGEMKDSKTSVSTVIDLVSKNIIYHPNKDYVMSDLQSVKDLIASFNDAYNQNGTKSFTYKFGGVNKIAACQKFDEANWLICSANELSDYDEALNKVIRDQSLFSLAFIVIIVGVLVYAINFFLRPLSAISTGLQSFFKFLNYETKEPVKTNVATQDEFGVMATLINENIAKVEQSTNQDNIAVSQSVDTAKQIENGNLKARITQNPANPELIELKNVLNKMLDTLELKVGSDLNEIQKVFNSYRNSNFTSKIQNPKGEVEMVTNALGDEISNMLRTNL
ncbi:PDC sensor domain-containing protein, partial [Campylobacter gastrosuis]